MNVRTQIRFYLNDELVVREAVSPRRTLLDFLRLDRLLRGTKEGCAEGDCGACTVLVGRLDAGGALVYEAVNACIRFLASLDGTHVVTIENLARPGLHPVQQALVDQHGSQCGFCTPGFVMSLYGQWLANSSPTIAQVEEALQGNLCRCTGYAPILRAAQAIGSYGDAAADPLNAGRAAMREKLLALQDGARVVVEAGDGRGILPANADDLAEVLLAEPAPTIVSGATDVGLWVTKLMRELPTMVFLSRVRDLEGIAIRDGKLHLGARVTYADAQSTIVRHFPQLAELWGRIGGQQVRNAGTIGGNIANGSPIGDTPPPLIVLGAELKLRRGAVRRTMPLEHFFIDYGRQDRQPGEFVEEIAIPLPAAEERFAAYKVSKRFDEDISAVLGAFRVRIEDGVVVDVAIAYGGMAATPKRAIHVERALVGKAWTRATVEAAMAAYAADFTPLTDWRASAEYRATVAKNLLLRFWAETSGTGATRVRELADA